MSLFLPFNHRPSLVIANPASYTCPAGKYARVVATMTTNALYDFTVDFGLDVITANMYPSSESNSESIEFWIKTGDVVSKSIDNISASTVDTITSSTTNLDQIKASDTGFASVLLNGTTISSVVSSMSVSVMYNVTHAFNANVTLSASGTSSVNMVIEEYDIA